VKAKLILKVMNIAMTTTTIMITVTLIMDILMIMDRGRHMLTPPV